MDGNLYKLYVDILASVTEILKSYFVAATKKNDSLNCYFYDLTSDIQSIGGMFRGRICK